MPVSDDQVFPATSIGGGLADDPRVQTGVTPCRTVIAERRAISVSTPHGGDDNTRALSTVSMDISYVVRHSCVCMYVKEGALMCLFTVVHSFFFFVFAFVFF